MHSNPPVWPARLLSRSLGDNLCRLQTVALAVAMSAAILPATAQSGPDISGNPISSRYLLQANRPKAVPGTMVVPASSQIHAEDKGMRARTNVRFVVPAKASPFEAPFSGYGYETPQSLACIYALAGYTPGCNPDLATATPKGGSQTIAVVDAYHDPDAAADLAFFSDQFGLPFSHKKFQVVYASGSQPPTDATGGWELEESLDIEYAHAMAPNAMLYLVEANSSSFQDLFKAVTVATNLVQCGSTTACPSNATGKGEVSMSWGGGEWPGEVGFDSYFNAKNVVFLASSGDGPGTIYPAVSPNVISVGGTSTARSLMNGNLIQEIAWADGGGGLSDYEPMPSYQAPVAALTGGRRATPDVAADANPATGVWVYDSFPVDGVSSGAWWIVGGTSVSAPTWTGILNAASTANGSFAASTAAELSTLYGNLASGTSYTRAFKDITYGACGYYSGDFSVTGYDLCTGLGSPKSYKGK